MEYWSRGRLIPNGTRSDSTIDAIVGSTENVPGISNSLSAYVSYAPNAFLINYICLMHNFRDQHNNVGKL